MVLFARMLIAGSFLIASACAHTRGDLSMVVTFKDAGGLTVGDPVRLGDAQVGTVQALRQRDDGTVAIELRVDAAARDRVTEDATFAVARQSLLGGRCVEVETGKGAPVGDGATLAGQPSFFDKVAGLADRIDAWLKNPELREQLMALGKDLRELAGKSGDEVKRVIPELERRAEAIEAAAKREGPEVAAKVKEALDEMLDAVRD
jgi:hypothetical protein